MGLEDCFHLGLPLTKLPLKAEDKPEDYQGNSDKDSQSPLEGVKAAIDSTKAAIYGVKAAIHFRAEIIDAFVECLLAFFEPRQSLHDLPVGNPWSNFHCQGRAL